MVALLTSQQTKQPVSHEKCQHQAPVRWKTWLSSDLVDRVNDTYVDQSKVVFVDWELLRTNVFLQSRGIGALRETRERTQVLMCTVKHPYYALNRLHIIIWRVPLTRVCSISCKSSWQLYSRELTNQNLFIERSHAAHVYVSYNSLTFASDKCLDYFWHWLAVDSSLLWLS